jgi:hypothetical protein
VAHFRRPNWNTAFLALLIFTAIHTGISNIHVTSDMKTITIYNVVQRLFALSYIYCYVGTPSQACRVRTITSRLHVYSPVTHHKPWLVWTVLCQLYQPASSFRRTRRGSKCHSASTSTGENDTRRWKRASMPLEGFESSIPVAKRRQFGHWPQHGTVTGWSHPTNTKNNSVG